MPASAFVDGSDSKGLIVGIDVGTTYSSVAYCWHGRPHELLFPTAHAEHRVPQLKSQILLSEGKYYIGSEVDDAFEKNPKLPEEDRITLFKLGLDDSDVTVEVRTTLSKQAARLPPAHFGEGRPRKPVLTDLVTLFLGRLYDKIRAAVKRAEGIEDSVLDSARYIIGVPPCWSLKSSQAMVKAAELAEIPNIQITTEVEAVVSRCVRELGDTLQHDVVLIYDIGGGTTVGYSKKIYSWHHAKACLSGNWRLQGVIPEPNTTA